MSIPSYGNPGLGSVGAFQKSGQPFSTGSVDCTSVVQISFPYVTKFVQVVNKGSSDVRLGWSANGVAGDNFVRIPVSSSSPIYEIMVTSLFLSGSNSVDVMAGLTGIIVKGGLDVQWSGSAGVG